MPDKATDSGAGSLDLEPRLKVKRLNRLAVLLAAMLGIIVLWVGYFVLSTRPSIAQGEAQLPSAVRAREPAAIDRLEREALIEPAPPPGWTRPRRLAQSAPAADPFEVPRPVPTPPARPILRQEPSRPTRAYASDVLVSEFQQGSTRATRRERPEDLASQLAGLGLPDLESLASEAREAALSATTDGPAPEPLDSREAFLRQARERAPEAARVARLERPLSPYELKEGTLIPAILAAGIHSDLPGQTSALVRRNVYDTTSGRHLLIPRGSRLIGEYDHRIAWGQKRVLLAWHRLIFPDGTSLDLGGMPGADLAAMAGVKDEVHNHFVRTFGSAILLSAMSAGAQLSQPQESAAGGAPSARQLVAGALGQELGRLTAELTRRNVDLEPTLEIRPGYLFHVEVTGDLVLPGPYRETPLLP